MRNESNEHLTIPSELFRFGDFSHTKSCSLGDAKRCLSPYQIKPASGRVHRLDDRFRRVPDPVHEVTGAAAERGHEADATSRRC
jgi:hypothetical protein